MSKNRKSKSNSTPKTSEKLDNEDIKPKQAKRRKLKHEQEEEDSPQVYFGTASPFLQSVILCHILENNHFSLFEQIEMRRVCRLWHYNVKHIWAKTRSLVLTMEVDVVKPKLSSDLLYKRNFNFDFDTSTLPNRVELIIGKDHFDLSTIDLLGDLFCNIEHFAFFYELPSLLDYCTVNLCRLLQMLPKMKSFSLFIPESTFVKFETLPLLFETFNHRLTQLHTLHIHMSNHDIDVPALKKKLFIKTLSSLQNFSLNCSVKNLSEMLKTVGKSLSTPMQSLSISVVNEKLIFPVTNLFTLNPNLSQIKRLELNALNGPQSLNIVSSFIDHFAKVECLYLTRREGVLRIELTTEWIQILNKLPHLKELHLLDFDIELLKDWLVKSLPNIRKLTIVQSRGFRSYSFCFSNILRQYYAENDIEWPEKVEPKLMHSRFLSCFAKQFPRLEQLTIRQTANYDFDEHFSSMCFTEFYHLKSLRLEGRNRGLTFTS